MSGSQLIHQWISEFCAPVVVTLATPEVERICLQNGLLLHELLSCFGHLDGVNTSVRVNTQSFPVNDAHIRFERVTEVKAKTTENVEDLLKQSFAPFDISSLPGSLPELRSTPPTAWTNTTEQIVARSLSFSEYEMLSNPIILLTVVATSDTDPLAAMQDLVSIHHTPTCFSNGQYDSTIQRVFLVIEDAAEKGKDTYAVLRSLNSVFPSSSTKLISINSFSRNALNLQQPDMWSRFLIPKYFSQHAPALDASACPAKHPSTGKAVLGARLTVEDFMRMREFCLWLFVEQIVPGLERRIASLSKQVNDARKGMKNVWKSFFRKPREEGDSVSGGVKYRFDKIESQTLMLADLSFMVRDFETAAGLYKTLRDDFKADKSFIHLAHVHLMLAVCQWRAEPQRYKEVFAQLECVSQCIAAGFDVAHAYSYFALLCAELYVASALAHGKSPLDGAKVLLQASGAVSRYPVLSALLVERAALHFMQAGQTRKYVLHCVLAGNKLYKCGAAPALHASVCAASALMFLEKSSWSDPQAKLSKALALDLKTSGREHAQRSLIFLLKMLGAILDDDAQGETHNGGGSTHGGALLDAVSVLSELSRDGPWGRVAVGEGWQLCSARDILLGCVPVGPLSLSVDAEDMAKSRVEVEGLAVPAVDPQSVEILEPVNGPAHDARPPWSAARAHERGLLLALLDVERRFVAQQQQAQQDGGGGAADAQDTLTLEELWVQAEKDFHEKANETSKQQQSGAASTSQRIAIPLGESVIVALRLHNKLPVDLSLDALQLVMDAPAAFAVSAAQRDVLADASQEIVLRARPTALGAYSLRAIRWQLSDHLVVHQPLRKRGPLLQRNRQQRVNRERGVDASLQFDVVPAQPLLQMELRGLAEEVLQGQLCRTRLRVANKGAATASEIFIKLSQPCFVFALLDTKTATEGEGEGETATPRLLDFFGMSATVVSLAGVNIAPGESVELDAWLRVTQPGLQRISLLLGYQALGAVVAGNADGTASTSSSEKARVAASAVRTSYLSVQTRAVPSLGLALKLAHKPSSVNVCTLVTEVTNYMRSGSAVASSAADELDLCDAQHDKAEFDEIDANCVKVVGLWMIGGGEPSVRARRGGAPSSSSSGSGSAAPRGFYVSPSERVTQCFSVSLFGAKSGQARSNWLVPLSAAQQQQQGEGGAPQLTQIVERFLCMWYTHHEFTRKLQDARITVQLTEEAASAAGPRSIAEVRRERQRLAALRADSDPSEDWDAAQLDALSADDDNAEVATDSSARRRVAAGTPQSAHDVAMMELKKNCVNMVTVWVCRWGEKIRWGMHHSPHLGLHHTESNAFSNVHISLQHARSVAWDASSASLTVPVTVTVRSLSYQCVRVSVRTSGAEAATTQREEEGSLRRVHSVGFAWVNKVLYEDVVLPAQEDVDLSFCVKVYAPGVYDLNKFLVAALYAKDHHDVSLATHYPLPGQSLLTVL